MSKNYESFGVFLKEKRLSCNYSYRELSKLLNISAPYLSDIEKGRRNAPSLEKLEMLANILSLDKEEKQLMYNLAGKKKNTLPPDLPDYIKDNTEVIVALRTAKDLGAKKEDWENFIKELERRNK